MKAWDLSLLRYFFLAVTIMKMRIVAVIVAIALLGAARAQASAKAEAKVKAAKGPVQITLQVQNTSVKVEKSLWYKLELKNVGKKRFPINDRIFTDPNAIHLNSKHHSGIYLEILDSKGKPLDVRPGNYQERFDWEGPEGQDYLYTPEEKKELWALQDEWKKRGMTEQQQSLAVSDWNRDLIKKKNYAEMADPAKKHWLAPGSSTATFAWSDRGPGEYDGRSDDDESLRQGYTELWSYWLLTPGKYRLRAVYKHSLTSSTKALFKKHGHGIDPSWIDFKTPFVDFEVLP